MSHFFDEFVLLTPIPSKISILSYYNIYNSHKYSSKKTCG